MDRNFGEAFRDGLHSREHMNDPEKGSEHIEQGISFIFDPEKYVDQGLKLSTLSY